MAPQKSPAFSFYAKDFTTGTATMSLQEVGAYIRLLSHQWDAGSIPADPGERARVLGCAKAQERELWKKVGKKFVLRGDVYLNERLEGERRKQVERRQRLSDNGKLGGRGHKANENLNESNSFSSALAVEKLDERLPVSSSSSLKDQHTHTARANGHGRGANAPGALQRDHLYHGLCSAKRRCCLSERTAAELADKWGGNRDDAMKPLQEFIDGLEARIGDGAKGDHVWLLQHFEAFMHDHGRVPVAAPKPTPANGTKSLTDEIDEWAKS